MIGRTETSSPLVEEYRICNTPVIGTYLFWCFAKSFVKESDKIGEARAPHFLLYCYVAAIFSDRRILDELQRRRGISSFRRYLTSEKKGVLFDGIHARVKEMLPYALAALDVAYTCGILRMDAETGCVAPIAFKAKRGTGVHISKDVTDDVTLAETLGRWFARYDGPVEVAKKLEVVL